MERVALSDADIWTDTTGVGERAVVLCHGGPGLSDNLGPLASLIDDIAVVHRYDQRAGGRSTGKGPCTVAQFVDDLDRLRRHWGHDSWVVGGHSWGGWLALVYALNHPSAIVAIIAVGTPPPPTEGWRDTYVRVRNSRLTPAEREFFDDVRLRRRAGLPISPEDERRWIELGWRTDFADAQAVPDFSADPLFRFPVNYEVNRALNEDMDMFETTHDLPVELSSVTAPALFIHGEGDPRPSPRSVASAMPNARLVEIEGAGHLPWLEKPDDVSHALREFILGLPPDDTSWHSNEWSGGERPSLS